MTNTTPLDQAVRDQLERYFQDLGGSAPHDILDMVCRSVERTVLQVALERTAANQTRAAAMLGITRSTLRKKLQNHQIQVDSILSESK